MKSRISMLILTGVLAATYASPTVSLNQGAAQTDPRGMRVQSARQGKRRGLGGLPLRGYEFDVATVNSTGSITNRRKGQGQYCVEDINGVWLEMVEIPGGRFMMGSSEYGMRHAQLSTSQLLVIRDLEGPQHQVTVQPFYIGKYEVTQAQWRAIASLPKVSRDLNADPSHFKGDNLPVEQVSWDDAVEFCARLRRATGHTYRLPTEAEWEYACRGGTNTPFAFGETITPEIVNYNGLPYDSAPVGLNRAETTPVRSMRVANMFGLYDMHGNVWEWCLDYWHASYKGAPTDGRSWDTAGDMEYVVRGGSWNIDGFNCRTAVRSRNAPGFRFYDTGFRVVAVAQTHLPR